MLRASLSPLRCLKNQAPKTYVDVFEERDQPQQIAKFKRNPLTMVVDPMIQKLQIQEPWYDVTGGHFRSAPDLKPAETTLLGGVKTGGLPIKIRICDKKIM